MTLSRKLGKGLLHESIDHPLRDNILSVQGRELGTPRHLFQSLPSLQSSPDGNNGLDIEPADFVLGNEALYEPFMLKIEGNVRWEVECVDGATEGIRSIEAMKGSLHSEKVLSTVRSNKTQAHLRGSRPDVDATDTTSLAFMLT